MKIFAEKNDIEEIALPKYSFFLLAKMPHWIGVAINLHRVLES
jgi:hypothetical protein